MPETIITVGAGQTAAVAARTLRRRGFDGRIVLVGDEPHAPYQRPPLTKEFLEGTQEAGDTTILSEQWLTDNAVELLTSAPVERIDTTERVAVLRDGTRLPGDTFLLATGSRPRRLPAVEGERIIHLRGLDDASRLRAQLRPGARIIVIGAGFVGAEVASTAVAVGAEVVVLEQGEAPLARVLGGELGTVCGRIQRDHGVSLHTSQRVSQVAGTAHGVVVSTESGLRFEGDVVVVAIGALPNTDVARSSGIAVSDGVLVDEYCRTSVEGIFAAGDVANHRHPLFDRWIRVEHFDNANKQGMAAAKNMLGRSTVYDEPHWFWSDQFGLNLQHCGHADQWDELVIRGSVEELDFTAFYLRAGVVRASFAIERGDEVLATKQLIAQRVMVHPATLRDQDVDLNEMAAGAQGAGHAADTGALSAGGTR